LKVRGQLVLAFLALSVLPLAAIILVSYLTSQDAFRQAVAAEAKTLAREMGDRLGTVRQDLSDRLASLASLPVRSLQPGEGSGARAGQVYSDLMAQMGDMASLVESFEFTPLESPQPAAQEADGVTAPSAGEPFIIYPSKTLAQALERLERHGLSREESGISEEYLSELIGQATRSRELLAADELEAIAARGAEIGRLLGSEFTNPVYRGETLVGTLKALVPASQIVREVLSRTPRDQGEIPYARDSSGSLYADSAADQERLEKIGIHSNASDEAEAHATRSPDWIVVEVPDPESELVFGVARPVRASLRGIRLTAVRNFAFGLGLVFLAMVGIVALSGRMTRKLTKLTEGAERLGRGDLEARVMVRSKDEFGRLAVTFNRLAGDLRDNQERLLEQEMLRREEEVERRLLEAENQRKSRELEEARQFQLSLLPKALPHHAEVDIAVFMRTATEVGGDYYDFFVAESGALTTVIGDAAGHGARAGTMVTVVKGLLTASAAQGELPLLLGDASRAIKQMNLGRMNMAATLVRIGGGRVTISAAGMPPVLVHRSGADTVEEVTLVGTPLGSLATVTYQQWDSSLAAGDTVLLMTDGFPEALNPRQEPLGYGRVRDLLRAAAGGDPTAITQELAAAANDWLEGAPPNDDITFVVLKMKASAAS
jgi:serine phosphatase RsbU (regulator of sigma subunit)